MRTKSVGIPLELDPERKATQLYEDIDYKEFWTEYPRKKLDELEHNIIRSLLPASGHRIIDIGCGFGRLSNCYLDRFDQIVLLDGSMTLLRQARERLSERATFIAADATHIPFDNSSFDCALMIRVFHHLSDSQASLLELNRILGNNGSLVFNYCNKLSLRQFKKWLAGQSSEIPLSLKPAGIGTAFIAHHPRYVELAIKNAQFTDIKYLGAGVMDKFAGKLGGLENWLPSGESVAPLLGALKLAPWINCKAVAHGKDLDRHKTVEELLVCPSCHGGLQKTQAAYECDTCEKSYPITENIIDFRFD